MNLRGAANPNSVTRLCGVTTALAAAFLLWALVTPLGGGDESQMAAERRWRPAQDPSPPRIEPVLAQVASRPIMRAAEIKAAVKDNGAAQRLLGQLQLQGVLEMPEGLTAYVAVEKEGVRTIRKGDRLLEFDVTEVRPGNVSLNLDGVAVELIQ